MSRNIMSRAEEREYADWILELRQQEQYTKRKQANEHWHRVAERLAHAFGAGDPDAAGRADTSGLTRTAGLSAPPRA